jgi:hypothetical protein
MSDHRDEHDIDRDFVRPEQGVETSVPALTRVQQLQRTVGNARLLQLRRAVQRQETPAADVPDWVKAGLGLDMRGMPASAEAMEASSSAVDVPTGGQPLPDAVRLHAENALGVSLDGVSIASGADSACKPIQAQAFTADDGGGKHTVALSSDVNLDSEDGQFTLMHELAHVAQQKRGEASELSGLGGDAGSRDNLEHAADRAAAKMVSGK